MLYKYKAKKLSDGELIEGTRESEGKFSLLQELKEEGFSLLVAEETEGGGMVRFLVRLNEVVIRIRLHDKIIFARNLAAMISAGLSLSRALEILEKQTTNAKFKKIMGALGKEIKDAGTLSSGLKKYPN
ncbi:MAG: type II secretion system F family protein, partial [Patescibacteria group bacterium]